MQVLGREKVKSALAHEVDPATAVTYDSMSLSLGAWLLLFSCSPLAHCSETKR